MSKAFVIKNKEGKYWRSKFNKKGNILLTDDIVDAMPYEEDELKILECPKDCTIVPITIYEGDPLELACEETDNYWNEQKAFEKKMTLYDYFIQQAKEMKDDNRKSIY